MGMCREDTLVDRFHAKYRKGKPDECWRWLGAMSGNGYGTIARGDSCVYAHRLAWELTHGRLPENGKVIMHICDNPLCVNPAHLKEDTQWSNMIDMYRKGRDYKVKGIDHPNAKLSEEQVRDIKFSTLSNYELAEKHSTGIPHVINIKAGRKWKHITRNPPETENEQAN